MEWPKTIEEAVTNADLILDQGFERWERSLEPVWRAEGEFKRTLITLAAGAFVVTLSLVQLLATQTSRTVFWKWTLPASWILFGVTVFTGALTHRWEAAARIMRHRFEQKRGDVRAAVRAIPIGAVDYGKQFEAAVGKINDEVREGPDRALRVYNRLSEVCLYAFAAGMAALLAFAIRNLPF
jgi:uncharacterized integral membrane protein